MSKNIESMKNVAVIGAGTMGNGIAHTFAQFGYSVSLIDVSDSSLEKDDTRKTRLTLSQINRIRKASELHTEEKREEQQFVKQMYGIAANAEPGV